MVDCIGVNANDFAILHDNDVGAFLFFEFNNFGVDGGDGLLNFVAEFNLLFVARHNAFLVRCIYLD